jgi:hypothetical protein
MSLKPFSLFFFNDSNVTKTWKARMPDKIGSKGVISFYPISTEFEVKNRIA